MPITVSTHALGRRKPLLADFSVPPPEVPEPGEGDDLRLRHVIAHIVRQQVEAFHTRQAAQRFDRVLSASQIDAGAAAGKVAPGASEHAAQRVDVEDAIGAALLAFEDGLYLVILDGAE